MNNPTPNDYRKEAEEEIDKIWSRGNLPKWADNVKTGVKRILARAAAEGDRRGSERVFMAVTTRRGFIMSKPGFGEAEMEATAELIAAARLACEGEV